MHHAKKMVLIDPAILQRTQDIEQIKPNTMSLLDKEMKSILETTEISDHDKWLMYQQALQKFLQVTSEKRQPLSIPIVDDPNMEKEQELDDNDLLNTFPKSLKNKASLLLKQIKQSGVIAWDGLGCVSIHGNRLQGSNIIDLLNDVIRSRKTDTEPAGRDQFIKCLSDINVPHILIGNKLRREFLNLSDKRQLDQASFVELPKRTLSSENDIKEKRNVVKHYHKNIRKEPLTKKKRKIQEILTEKNWEEFKL